MAVNGFEFSKIPFKYIDFSALIIWFSLIVIGLVMVSSASMPEANIHGRSDWYFSIKQVFYYVLGFIAAFVVFNTPIDFFKKNSSLLLVIGFFALLLVFVPFIGVKVKGSRRWLNLIVFRFQVGELIKFLMIIFSAYFLEKNYRLLRNQWWPIVKLLSIGGIFVGCFAMQPDFGTSFVVVSNLLILLFLAGMPIKKFAFLFSGVAILMALFLISAPYRVIRLFSFLNPWKDAGNTGYQLVNSLISFGNGGIFGVGLGESMQKRHFLPEAHTDFIFSIIAEELGLVGAFLLLLLIASLVWRAFVIANIAHSRQLIFESLIAYGIGSWIALQTLINVGVATGVLPTKGLTMPFISYGGSSVLVFSMAMALLLRISAQLNYQAKKQ